MDFQQAVEFVLGEEGGLSDNPSDAGKLTKWGISSVFYPQVESSAFTRDAALAIYKSDFWDRFRCAELPAGLGLVFFDCAVNQTGQAVRLLQRALNVKADGVLGPVTLAAAGKADVKSLIAELVARRSVAYAEHPDVKTFGLGWYRRLAACHASALEAS